METFEFAYTIAPKTDADAEGLDVAEGVATKAGRYTLLVTCTENPKATAEIVIVVLTPVKITFPSQLELSKFKDTELNLTFVEGDNFDPDLLEIQIMVLLKLLQKIFYTKICNLYCLVRGIRLMKIISATSAKDMKTKFPQISHSTAIFREKFTRAPISS